MKIKWLSLLLPFACFAQSSDFTQNFGAVPPINRGQIVKMSSTGQVVPMLTTDTTGAIGIATTSTTSSNVLVTLFGAPLVAVDGSCTPGNVVLISTTAAGQGHCASAASNQVIGIATSVASNGFATVQLAPLSSAGASGIPPNTPLPGGSSGPGPVFNVKNYGATANTVVSTNCTGSGTNLNCTDVTFTAANVGQRVSCASGFSTFVPATTTFTAFVNSTNMTMSAAGNGAGECIFGTPDDAALTAAFNAAFAFCISVKEGGNTKVISSAPTLYFPAGAYNFFNTGINIAPASPCSGFTILGDGLDITKLYWNTGSSNATGAAITNNGSVTFTRIENLTMDGAVGNDGGFGNAALYLGGSVNNILNNVKVQRFSSNGIGMLGSMTAYNIQAVANGGIGIFCQSCNGEIRNPLTSNNTLQGLEIVTSNGEPGGNGVKIFGGLVDENGAADSVLVQKSTDVWFIGPSFFSGSTKPNDSCLHVDSTSYVHFAGGICGVFNGDTNETAMVIDAGGILEASDLRMVGTGTGNCIKNSGTFINNGANSCESMFNTVTAATSSGTTATLTVTTQTANVNTVCSVGDNIMVQNMGVAGYNGYFKGAVTAVGTNTISYTTPGSNLAASSGAAIFCKGFVTYSGTLPYSTITPTPNTCYVTGTFGAITLCNQFVDRAVNIYRIKASSGVTTACTVAPVVTISDGTNSATLTITTAKSTWDSSVDASTNVGNTIYVPHGGTITVSTTAGTCTTPPTNFALTYTMQAVLDN